MKPINIAFLPLALAALSVPALAADFDTQFLSKLHQANQQEIEAGKLAQSKGQSAQMKQYGERLVKDHRDADQKVMQVAQEAGIQISSPPKPQNAKDLGEMAKEKESMAQLHMQNASGFDSSFKQMMMVDHKKDIQEVTDAIPQLKGSKIKDLAKNLLPTLKAHETMAENLPG